MIGIIAVVLVIGWGARKVNEVAQDFQENPAKKAAEMVVKFNPDLEMVSSDEVAGTMTIKMKDTGEEVTLDYQDIADGKFSVTTAEGTTTVDGSGGKVTTTTPEGTTVVGGGGGVEQMPDWFDLPEGLSGWQQMMRSERNGKLSAMLKAESAKPVEEMAAALKANLEAKGFEETGSVTSGAAMSASYAHAAEGKTVSISMSKEGGKDFVIFTLTEK